jgi:hypothetical protein
MSWLLMSRDFIEFKATSIPKTHKPRGDMVTSGQGGKGECVGTIAFKGCLRYALPYEVFCIIMDVGWACGC